MIDPSRYSEIAKTVALVDYSLSYKLREFDCGILDYNSWIQDDAPHYLESCFCDVKLLINTINADVVAYMALSMDAFSISEDEKKLYNCKIGAIPSLKVGKLAVNQKYQGKGVCYLMLTLALGIADDINKGGKVRCRFISIDADEEDNPGVSKAYLNYGFVNSEKNPKRRKPNLRYDIFQK